MKIEKVTPLTSPHHDHPLADITTWYMSAALGETVKVSGLPLAYMGRSAESLAAEFEELLAWVREENAEIPAVRVENANPRLRTPDAYIVTKLA